MNTIEIEYNTVNNFRIFANGFGRKFFEFLICLTGVSLDEHH